MKYYVKKYTPLNKRVSKTRENKRKLKHTFGSLILKRPISRIKTISLSFLISFITILAFVVNSPVFQTHPNELKSFNLSSDTTVFRTGKPISFKWALMGTPQKLIIVFGDGSFQELSSECFKDNGMVYGSVDHIYEFQGKYTPILKAYYPGKTVKRILDVAIRNDAPLFSFGFNGENKNTEGSLHTSTSPYRTFEDEEVDIKVDVTNNLANDTLTYQFNFGDSQVVSENNSITHSWNNQGSYPVTITVVGTQGELSKQTQYIDVLNRRPSASFKIISKHDIAVGKEIKFSAESSSDTQSDKNNLRFIWNWGDGLMDYGKIASHTYYESGSYNVTLIVKDDDSFIDQTSHILDIENITPDIAIVNEFQNFTLIVNEGEEVIFSTSSQDDDPDIFKLLYYWNFDSLEFDPRSLENFQLGGWKNKHIFEDDFEGNVTVGVIDSSNEFNSDSIGVKVVNVAPEIGFISANIVSNVSFQVFRNNITMEANFTFDVFRDNESIVSKPLSFSNSNQTDICSNKVLAHFNPANEWKINVNSSDILPVGSLFQASIRLIFVDGQELVLNSEQMLGGSYGEWEVELSSEFYDEQNFSYKYPITYTTQLFDPSKDEVSYSISYQESKLLEINCFDILPITHSFIVESTEYTVEVYEQDLKQYANISAQKLVFSELFDDHTFPLSEETQINISPLINILDVLQGNLGLSDLNVESCLIADNRITILAIDDDLGEDTLTFCFDSLVGIELTQNFVPITNSVSSNVNPKPFGKIGGFSSTVFEGDWVKFTSKTNEQDVPGMIFMWDFGDGTVAYSEHAKHAWVNAGVYNITLTIADPYGNIHRDQKNITILPKAPEIVGPFAFQGSEGSSIVLDVEIYDSTKDELSLEYFWYDNKGTLVSQEQKPVFTLDDGTYVYTLKVVDPSGMSCSKEIVVNMHSLSPEIYMPNYMYHGVEGEGWFDNDGELELTAYGADSLLDSEKLLFYWTIRSGKNIFRLQDGRYQHYSTITFTCKETTTYQGEVRIVDPEGNEKVVTFQIVSTIDSTLDGVDDETEEMLRLSDEPSDTDGDGLTDTYEMTVSNTSYLNPDTDGDLLWDGQTVNGSIGEQAISTDPLDWDSDDDFLSDGTEYFGWNITVVYFENSSTFHVTSESLDNDTDNDGLTDYAEYYAGSNPRQADTDNDDLTDDIDPFPANWDGDEDMLSDYEEIMRGTDWNNTDSDQDGLTDGAEVYGWGIGFFTNPLEADSDHDHVSDSAELKNYLVKLQDNGFEDLDKKVPISQPVSLHFPHHFEQAVAAQISFGISFGEYGENATSSYGVEDTAINDLSIIITKKSDGMLLANFTTNSTRYFSQTVDITPIMNNKTLELDYFGDYEIALGFPSELVEQEGCYPGSYSFEDEEDGTSGTSIDFIDVDANSITSIISDLDSHSKILKYENTAAWQVALHNINDKATGTVEFWIQVEQTDVTSILRIKDGSDTSCLIFEFRSNGVLAYYDGSYHTIQSYSADTWYHFSVEWDCVAHKWYLWIDGVSKDGGSGYNFWTAGGVPSAIDNFEIIANGGAVVYYDAIGFSWDPNYEIGDNEDVISYNYEYSSGHFDATYSFKEEEDGTSGTSIDFIDVDANSITSIISDLDSHSKILKYENTAAWQVALHNINDKATGTVEFWIQVEQTDITSIVRIKDGSDTICLILEFRSNGVLAYYDGSYHTIQSYSADTWYHFKVEWDCATHKWYLWIDGVSKDGGSGYNFWTAGGVPSAIDNFEIIANGGAVVYYDAIGFSWDPDYNIGDNLLDNSNPGCYLEYFNLEFCRYLDPNDPDSDDDGILDGVEMGVLVRGNDTLEFEDYYYYNNLTLNPIGNFSATYSFEEELVGTTNTDIEFIDSVIADSSCVANITSEFKYHNKVLELSDDNNAGKIYAYNTAFDRQNGTIEFWWAQTENDKDSIVYLYDDGTGTAISLYMRSNGQYSWYDGSWHDVLPYSANAWYHHKITFNCSKGTNGKFSWYIDGVLEAESKEFRDDCDSLDKLLLGTGTGSSGFDTYFDAIGFTWNWSYWEGENYETQLPEGLGSGHYYGTYSFENEEDGTSGTYIDFVDTDVNDITSIISSLDSHSKILKYENTAAWQVALHNINDKASETVDFWIQVGQTDVTSIVRIKDGSDTSCLIFEFRSNGVLAYYDGSYHTIQSYSADIWYHFSVEWDCVVHKWYLWIDQVSKDGGSGYNFWTAGGVPSAMDNFEIIANADAIMYYDAIGYSWDPDYDVGDNLIFSTTDLDNTDDFYLEIPQIGVVYDSQLYIEVESNGTPEGSGKVFVQLIKEQMNCSNNDISLLDYCGTFDSTQPFSYEKSLDLSPYISTNEVYGTYKLRVQTFSTGSTDIFNLTKFEIESDTYIAAEFGETEAWVTNPAEEDSDGDNLSDSYEIFSWGTNPLSVDTDGDGSWDDTDIDPLRDVMLKIQPLHGMYTNSLGYNPIWQIVMNCSFVSEDYAIITPCEITTETSPHKAYFTDYQYYINIDDEEGFYDDEVLIPLELWEVKRHLGQNDIKRIDGDYYIDNLWYDFTDSATQELWTVYNSYYVFVEISQVAVEKANTIALYDVNSTFTGRYHDREQGYSIIQLQIPDEGHYFGSESFLEEQIGANSSNIAFVDDDDSDIESMVNIVEEVDGHTNVLCLQEGLSEHADITHNFGGSRTYETIEWWWRTSKISGGISYFYLKNGNTDVIRLFMRDGKIKYHDGSYHDVMTASSNTWYRMKLVFFCKVRIEEIYRFALYVDDVLKVGDGTFYSDEDFINNLRITTMGDSFNSYFDAFGFSWDSNYDIGDNSQTYSVEGTPFEHGMNVIIVPTELFTHTLLHGYVENDDLDQTPLYHPSKNKFQFSAIERDGQPTQANADADLMFYRRSISPSDAMEVLELVLKGLLNESWEENDAINIHSYVSTKLNGTKATQMNLPYSVLGYVPWFNPNTNSKMGDEPIPSGGFDLFLWLLCLFNPILAESLHSQMAMSGGDFYKYLKGFTESILMSIMTFLGDLLWLIARAALFILFYILLAIELVIISVETLVMGASFLVIGLFLGIDISFGLNWAIPYGIDTCAGFVEITQSTLELKMETWITWIYWDFFELYMPWITYNMVQNDVIVESSQTSIIDGKTKEEYEDAPFVPVTDDVLLSLFNNTCEVLGDDAIKFRVDYFDKNAEEPYAGYGIKVHIITPSGTALSEAGLSSIESSPDFTTGDFIPYEYSLDTSTYDDGLWQYYFTAKDGSTEDLVRFPNEGYFVGANTADSPKLLFSPNVYSESNDFEPEGWKNDDFTFSIFWWDPVDENEPDEVKLCLIPAQPSIGGTGSSKTAGIQRFEMDQVESSPNFADPVEYSCTENFASLGYQDSEIGRFYHYFEAITTSGEVITSLSLEGDSYCNYYGPYVKSESSMSYNLEISSTNPLGSRGNVLSAGEEIYYILEVSDSNVLDTSNSPVLTYSLGDDDFDYVMELVELSASGKDATYLATIDAEDLDSGKYDVDISTPSGWDSLPSYERDKLQAVYVYNFINSMILNFGDTLNKFGNTFIILLAAIGGIAILDRLDLVIASGIGVLGLFGLLTAVELQSLEASGDSGGLLGLSLGCLVLFAALDSMFGDFHDEDLALKLLGYLKFTLLLSTISNVISAMTNEYFPENEAASLIFDFFDSILFIFPQLVAFIIGINFINAIVEVCNIKGSSSTATYRAFVVWYKRFVAFLAVFSMISFIVSLFGGYEEYNEFSQF